MTSVACCSGIIDKGIPEGHEEKIDGVNCYVTPRSNISNNKVAVVILSDVFGYKLPNTRLIADNFSKQLSVLVIAPDLFNGFYVPPNLMDTINILSGAKKGSFLTKVYGFFKLLWYLIPFRLRNLSKKSQDLSEKIIQHLKTNHGIEKIAVQGYCWGGALATYLGQKANIIDVFASAHPGGLKVPLDFDKVIKPACFILPEKDHITAEQIEIIKQIFVKKVDTEKLFPFLVKDYPKMVHGFAVRGTNYYKNVIIVIKFTTVYN